MKYGAPFIGAFATCDPIAIRDYVQAVEGMGFNHLYMDEVLLNNNPEEIFHESMTFIAYLSAVTTKLNFVTGVMILPKRSTLLLARQTAEIDILSNGRLRLGVGVGWSEREFQAMGIDFHTRGQRIEEQITLLRALWTEPTVSFQGKYHMLDEIGINMLPFQRHIPIWMGGGADVVLRRTARMSDGWLAYITSDEKFQKIVEKLRVYLEEFGRSANNFSIINYLELGKTPQSLWEKRLVNWRAIGVTHAVALPQVGDIAVKHRLAEALNALKAFRETVGPI